MFARMSPAFVAFGGSALLLAILIAALYFTDASYRSTQTDEALMVYCAEAMRLPMATIAREYEAEYGQRVMLDFGASQTMLTKLKLSRQGDLFLPADDSYILLAQQESLVSDVFYLARMHAVLVVSPHCSSTIASWGDLVNKDCKIGLANPESAAISKILKKELQARGLWEPLARRNPRYLGNVSEVANAALLGSIDAGVVWDVIALPHPELKIVKLGELAKVEAQVQIALATASQQPDKALRLVRFLRAADKGGRLLKKLGYSNVW